MVYVTSDLHGYPFEKFMKLLEKVNFSENDTLYILGDVIDRGNDGIEYLKWIMITPNIRFILGNHEYMFLNSGYYPLESGAKKIKKSSIQTVNEKKSYDSWLYNGGDSTLEALKKETPKTVEKIMKFLKNVPLYEEVRVGERDFVLVHGGLGNFSEEKELENYLPEELLWKRTTFNNRYYKDKITVLGHTPTVLLGYKYAYKAIFTDTWINIDTGAAGGYPPMLLRLDDLKPIYA